MILLRFVWWPLNNFYADFFFSHLHFEVFFLWKGVKIWGLKKTFNKIACSMAYENNCIHIVSWNHNPKNFPPSSGFTIKITISTTAQNCFVCVWLVYSIYTPCLDSKGMIKTWHFKKNKKRVSAAKSLVCVWKAILEDDAEAQISNNRKKKLQPDRSHLMLISMYSHIKLKFESQVRENRSNKYSK